VISTSNLMFMTKNINLDNDWRNEAAKLKWPRYARLSEVRNDQEAWKGVFGSWSKAIFYNGEITGPMWGSKIKSEPDEKRDRPECFASGLIQITFDRRKRLNHIVRTIQLN